MSLLSVLKVSKNTRKIFGQRELKIIEKQLLGVNLTQSEKNRLSRDIRPKFELIDELRGFKGEFKLKKAAQIHQLVDEARNTALGDVLSKKIISVVLFGSAADNTLTLESDIDIAVRFDEITLKEATMFRKRVSGRLDSKVDIQVYNVLPSLIQREIDKKGRVLFSRNEDKG